MSNRTQSGSKSFPADKHMDRGEWAERVTSDGNIALLKWKDNKSVLMLSTQSGSQPSDTCKRWSKAENKRIPVPRPACISYYNTYVGGIDLIDRYIAYYRTLIKTRKWTLRVFAHFLDFCASNSWIMYTRDCTENQIKKNERLSLLQFRLLIAEILIKGVAKKSSVGRPSIDPTDDKSISPPQKRRVLPLPPDILRYDGMNHFPQAMKNQNQSRCRIEGCSGKSRIKCVKCDLYLCLLNNDCFSKFHVLK